MSSLYNVEPQPTAKVLLQTTHGDILLELFAKQTPRTSRNFLQLCLDGYYDGTVFHRLVPKFVLQGGDPTGTGHGGESSYDGQPFEDEYHSRLKFNRRGLLGMANTGNKDDNGSQFFLTLAETPELQGRNTMFGRVVGDTIYNVMKMGEADLQTDGSERPLYPTKITGTEILVNPYEDMVKRAKKAQQLPEERKEKKGQPKRKAGKALLSFGGDEGEDMGVAPVSKKPKFNSKLISAGEELPENMNDTTLPGAPVTEKPVKSLPSKKKSATESKPLPRSPSPPLRVKPAPPPRKRIESPLTSRSSSPDSSRQASLNKTNAQIAALKASMKRDSGAKSEAKQSKSALEEMIPVTAIRGRRRKAGAAPDDSRTLKILNAFKTKLESAPQEMVNSPTLPAAQPNTDGAEEQDTGADDDEALLCDLHFIANCQSCKAWDGNGVPEQQDDDDKGWMSHALTFEKDRLGKDLEWKRKNEEELVVIDPREKARELKIDKRGKSDRDAKGANEKAGRDTRLRDERREPDRGDRERRQGSKLKRENDLGR